MVRRKRCCMAFLCLLGLVYLIKHIDYIRTETEYSSKIAETTNCCQLMKKECLACQMSMEVEDFCAHHGAFLHCSICSICEKENTKREDEIKSLHRKSYCKENPGTDKCQYNIMIAIALYPGQGLAEFTWSVITKYLNITNMEDIYIFPTDSIKSDEVELRKTYGLRVNIAAPVQLESLHKLILEAFLKSEYNILFILKSDMIFSKHWRIFIENNILLTSGYLSLYHPSYYHNSTSDCEIFNEHLCEGVPNGFQGYGIAVTRNFVKNILSNSAQSLESLDIFDGEKIRFFYPTKSLVMHIGQSNQSNSHCGLNTNPHRFSRCELPDWIQIGVEFYSDRCTNPNEQFQLGTNLTGRFWSRPAVSFSLYGTRPRYTHLAMLNAKRMSSIYPGWKMWIFYDDTVPEQVLRDLCEYNVRFINMTGSPIKNKMSWRFLVASEPVEIYAIRDIDSWILARGKAAVDEWIRSGKKFHVMRDHPFHARHPMNGGMWGGVHSAIPEMKDLLLKRNLPNAYIQDMSFLRDVVWPKAKESVWAHDSHSAGLFGEDHPFPLDMEDPRFFVGSVN